MIITLSLILWFFIAIATYKEPEFEEKMTHQCKELKTPQLTQYQIYQCQRWLDGNIQQNIQQLEWLKNKE